MTILELATPVELTEQQIKDAAASTVAQEIAAGAIAMLDSLDARHRMEFARVWEHPLLTPQEAVAQLGTLATTLFVGNTAVGAFLAEQYAIAGKDYAPPAVPEWATITPNPDGSITITGSPE